MHHISGLSSACDLLRTVIALLMGVAWLTAAGASDILDLVNGDRLSGELIELRDGVFVLDHPYSGEIETPQEAVETFFTAEPRWWRDDDGVTGFGPFFPRDGVQWTQADDVLQTMPVETLERIWPAEVDPDMPAPVEEVEEPEPPRLWSGTFDTGVAYRSGQVDSIDADAALNLIRATERTELSFRASGAYGEVESVLNTRQLKGQTRLKVYPRERFYLFGLTGLEHDAAKRLDLRWNTAFGAGYDIIDTDRTGWALDAGLDYAWERWDEFTPVERERAREAAQAARREELRAFVVRIVGDPRPFRFDNLRAAMDIAALLRRPVLDERQITREDWNLRISSYFRRTLFSESELTHEFVALPKFDEDWGEYRLLSDLAFVTPLTDSLNLRAALITEYESDPGVRGGSQWENTLRTGLRYSF